MGRLCSSGSAGSSPSGSTACAAGGGGIRRPESLDLERLACGPDVSGVQSAGEQKSIASASGLSGLLLGDGFGTIIVFLNSNDGNGCSEDCDVRVGEKNGEVQVWGS